MRYLLTFLMSMGIFLELRSDPVIEQQIQDFSTSEEVFFPSEEFNQAANLSTAEIFKAAENRDDFWSKQAECLDWFQKWDTLLQWNPPYAQWFLGGKLNASYNCLDRHMHTDVRNKRALIWEGERGEKRALTYEELYLQVNKFSNVLKTLGIKKGDKVAIYLPMIPEAVVAMLSCARLGAIHTVVFGGFSAEALKERILDSEAKLIITADGGCRKGKITPLKQAADLAAMECPLVEHIVVVKHAQNAVSMIPIRDCWYHSLMQNAPAYCPPEVMESEDILFILYTSGTTGKPKGIIHTTGGYMVGATLTTRWVFDIKPKDIYWCTADVGWITGHSYVVYGPLSNGMTQLIYEGAPDWPQRDRFWKLIEENKVSVLYTAPTLIRTFMKWGEQWLKPFDLSSLRVLGSVGEPINPQAWKWYHTHVGREQCPIVDTWWQTETGSIVISPIPGLTPLKPGSATFPLPGLNVSILNQQGMPSTTGYLAITTPWPSMLRGIHKDPTRYEETYWKKWDGRYYFTADGALQDKDGYIWLLGRVDDVINVSGHRISTMEIESALIENEKVAESAVIGYHHPIKGQAIATFVILKEGNKPDLLIENELKKHVEIKIGALARPEKVIFISDLPKTRSGKIMRRLLRDIAEERMLGDVTSLADPAVINEIKDKYQED